MILFVFSDKLLGRFLKLCMGLTQLDWDNCYSDGRTPWREHHRLYSQWIEVMKIDHGNVLDLGCGTGEKTIWFSQHGFNVESIDFSSEALSIARQQSGLNCFYQWDLEELSSFPF